MDAKQTGILTDLHARITAGDFGEPEVHSLFALLRDDAVGKRNPIRELGDFVAHRERDRGRVHRYLTEMKSVLDQRETKGGVLRVREVFSERQLADALDKECARHALAPLEPASHARVQFATLSMLQGVAMVDRAGARFGLLELAITRDRIELLGVVSLAKPANVGAAFPALTVGNAWYPMHAPNAHIRPTGVLRVTFRAGAAILEGVKPYETHIGRKQERGKPAPLPIEWAEVEAALPPLSIANVRPSELEFDVTASDGSAATFRLRDGRLSFAGLPKHFEPASNVWQVAYALRLQLHARVFDDTGGFLFETSQTLAELEPQ
jgi:hypothetical protein